MITIYANWTDNALATGATLNDARAKLNAGHCDKSTTFGAGPADLTALDTGPHETTTATRDKFDVLSIARGFFAEIPAKGPGRLPVLSLREAVAVASALHFEPNRGGVRGRDNEPFRVLVLTE